MTTEAFFNIYVLQRSFSLTFGLENNNDSLQKKGKRRKC